MEFVYLSWTRTDIRRTQVHQWLIELSHLLICCSFVCLIMLFVFFWLKNNEYKNNLHFKECANTLYLKPISITIINNILLFTTILIKYFLKKEREFPSFIYIYNIQYHYWNKTGNNSLLRLNYLYLIK
uniref:Uncharacterized protein n=1 Tax=Schizopora paradoxa TaxID=27342 RepID=A0A5B9RCP9_9AGAM|nr:hypothetical protein Schpa_000067 [Schizopora paradoxa]QEG57213.1 hypothetical protein Schpa_000067 [Schizopora paradoxa]